MGPTVQEMLTWAVSLRRYPKAYQLPTVAKQVLTPQASLCSTVAAHFRRALSTSFEMLYVASSVPCSVFFVYVNRVQFGAAYGRWALSPAAATWYSDVLTHGSCHLPYIFSAILSASSRNSFAVLYRR